MILANNKINYESELEEVILENLKERYLINSDEILYRYLTIKYNLLNYDYKNKSSFNEALELKKFILRELNIDTFIYKDAEIMHYGIENNLSNIWDSLKFRYGDRKLIDINGTSYTFDNYLKETVKEINKKAKKLSSPFKNKPNYSKTLNYFKIKILNKMFNIPHILNVKKIEGIKYDENFPFKLTLEEELERHYKALTFKMNSMENITEEDLESYIFKNLEKIEKGLRPIKRQYEIDNGRVDILAKDKDNNLVIIELKITNDKSLIWQVMYYPIALKNREKTDNVRVITICPEYPDYIKIPLKQIGQVEMFQYEINIINNKIEKIHFEKVS